MSEQLDILNSLAQATPVAIQPLEIQAIDDAIDWSKPKKKKKAPEQPCLATESPVLVPIVEDLDHTYEFMLARIYEQLSHIQKAQLSAKTKFAKPEVGKIGRKTVISNFRRIHTSMSRPAEHLSTYFFIELGSPVTLACDNEQLKIKGSFKQEQIQAILNAYVREYIICKVCTSTNTLMERDRGIQFVRCNSCQSRTSVASLRHGYQAKLKKDAESNS